MRALLLALAFTPLLTAADCSGMSNCTQQCSCAQSTVTLKSSHNCVVLCSDNALALKSFTNASVFTFYRGSCLLEYFRAAVPFVQLRKALLDAIQQAVPRAYSRRQIWLKIRYADLHK